MTAISEFGVGDASYRAAGELEGISALVDSFYDHMESEPAARKIFQMHTGDLSLTKTKLSYFLSGWLGGPRLYAEHFGGISIPLVHRHLNIGLAERDAWLLCMEKAIADQNYAPGFQSYLLKQLSIPAERVRIACAKTPAP